MAKKILLADDSLTIQKVVELTFSDSDYELVCVSNGQRALERVREDRPDLILADAVMPEKNGYEVCEAIKGDPATARIPVVLLSGTFEPFDRERAERIGADAIVSKPFDSHQLLAQVEALLERPREKRQTDPGKALTTEAIVVPPLPPPPEARVPTPPEEAPFDEGFAEADFTPALRVAPSRAGVDPFEEDYGRGDVDSAIAAFEKAHPRFGFGASLEPAASAAPAEPPRDSARDPQWLGEDAYPAAAGAEPSGFKAGEPERFQPPVAAEEAEPAPALETARTEPEPPGESPAMESPGVEAYRSGGFDRPEPAFGDRFVPFGGPMHDEADFGSRAARPPQTTEISARDAEVLFDVDDEAAAPSAAERSDAEDRSPWPAEGGALQETAFEPHASLTSAAGEEEEDEEEESRFAEGPPSGESPSGAVPGEIELLAQRSSIPELTQMLSSVRSAGDMSEEQIERLATRVVEKLSDRIVREIAWEVIPDMAELVIKQRIKELEAGVE